MLVLKGLRSLDTLGPSFDGLVVNASSIVHSESNILDSITMSLQLLRKLGVSGVQRRGESENDLSILDNVSAVVSDASLKTLSKRKL